MNAYGTHECLQQFGMGWVDQLNWGQQRSKHPKLKVEILKTKDDMKLHRELQQWEAFWNIKGWRKKYLELRLEYK